MADKILPEDEHTILRIAARNPTLREAAVDMGVSYQTLKNWLSTSTSALADRDVGATVMCASTNPLAGTSIRTAWVT